MPKREPRADVSLFLLEALLCLCGTRRGRTELRRLKAYAVVRDCDYHFAPAATTATRATEAHRFCDGRRRAGAAPESLTEEELTLKNVARKAAISLDALRDEAGAGAADLRRRTRITEARRYRPGRANLRREPDERASRSMLPSKAAAAAFARPAFFIQARAARVPRAAFLDWAARTAGRWILLRCARPRSPLLIGPLAGRHASIRPPRPCGPLHSTVRHHRAAAMTTS